MRPKVILKWYLINLEKISLFSVSVESYFKNYKIELLHRFIGRQFTGYNKKLPRKITDEQMKAMTGSWKKDLLLKLQKNLLDIWLCIVDRYSCYIFA